MTNIGGVRLHGRDLRRRPRRRRHDRRRTSRRHTARRSRSAPRYGPSKPAGNRSRTSSSRVATSSTPAIFDVSTRRLGGRGPCVRRLRECVRVQVDRQDRHDAAAEVEREPAMPDPDEEPSARARRAPTRCPATATWSAAGKRFPRRSASASARSGRAPSRCCSRDPAGNNVSVGWVGEVMAMNAAGTIAVGMNAGPQHQGRVQVDAVRRRDRISGATRASLLLSTGGPAAETSARTARRSPTRSPTTARSSPARRACSCLGVDDAAIYTPAGLDAAGASSSQSQGVLEASRWQVLGRTGVGRRQDARRHRVPARGGLLPRVTGWSSTRCSSATARAARKRCVSVSPTRWICTCAHGATVGFCPGQGPI